MDLINECNSRLQTFKEITGVAMKVHSKYRPGLLESAYEAAMEYLLKTDGHQVGRQKLLPMFWEDIQLNQTYRMDLVVDGIIVELKAVNCTTENHVRQLWNYVHLTHTRFGMIVNIGSERLYSAWYERDPMTGRISKVKLL